VLALSVMGRRSKLEMQEQRRQAGRAGGKTRGKANGEDTASSPSTKTAVAKQAKVPERKLRAIQELKKMRRVRPRFGLQHAPGRARVATPGDAGLNQSLVKGEPNG
jgi:hypothetical protein